jgi:3',5'-cyclic AMP phosphodiesterase CpdA
MQTLPMRAAFLALVVVAGAWATAQAGPSASVREISAPTHPLPEESASADVTRFSFIAYGDTRGRQDGIALQREHSRVLDSMIGTIGRLEGTAFPVRFVLQSGDAVVNGRDAAQWNRSFVDLVDRITAGAGLPYFLAPGNHDVTSAADLESPRRQVGLQNYLAAMARLIPPTGASRRLDGYPTYAFGYGNTFVLALDSNIAGDEAQFEWVRSQLEGLDRQRYVHVIAFFHHPLFSSGPHGGATLEPPTAVLRERYGPLFRRHHVRMTIAGHDHLYEHWVERYQDADGAPKRMDHVVTGGGGAPLYGYEGEPDLRDYLAAGAADSTTLEQIARPAADPAANAYHYVVVTVDGEAVSLQVVGVDTREPFRPYRSSGVTLSGALP